MSPRTQIVYRRNFLTNVILKINFPVILEISDGTPTTFQKSILRDFPILEPVQQMEFKIENKGLNVVDHKSNKILWKFHNKENTEFVELDFGSLAYIVKNYTDYSTFRKSAESIFSRFFSNFPSILISRLGLRYINQITLEGTDYFNWGGYLNQNLIKKIDFYRNKTEIRRLLTVSELALDEETVLNFKFGILNSTYPSPIVNREFLLDYDCHTSIQFEKEILTTKVNMYHRYIKDYFEASITDNLRKVLNRG